MAFGNACSLSLSAAAAFYGARYQSYYKTTQQRPGGWLISTATLLQSKQSKMSCYVVARVCAACGRRTPFHNISGPGGAWKTKYGQA